MESNHNPLLNDVIVGNIFECLDFDSLDECRNVCQFWRNVAVTRWCKLCPIRKIWQNKEGTNTLDVIGGTKGIDSWSVKRLNKFKLTSFKFNNNWLFDYKIWGTHGKQITVLEITHCEFTSATAFTDLFFCKATPVLETLTLIHIDFPFTKEQKPVTDTLAFLEPVKSLRKLDITYNTHYRSLPLEWELVLQCFIQLQSLSLSNYDTGLPPPTTTSCELTRVLHGFERFYKTKGRAHPLSYFNISEAPGYWSSHRSLQFPECILRLAREGKIVGLRPRSLGFTAALPADKDRCFELLAHQQRDLTRLKIRSKILRGIEIIGEDLNFPYLQQLTRLDLTEYRPLSFKFLLGCPNLKHLNIILKCRSQRETRIHNPIREGFVGDDGDGASRVQSLQQQQQFVSLPSLVSFHCNLSTDWNEEDMLVVGKWAPNLQSLLVVANESSFGGICQAFPQLRRLFLYDYKLTDETFTGLTSSALILPSTSSHVVSFPRRPNITDFKHLQVIGLDTCTDGEGRVGVASTSATNTCGVVNASMLRGDSVTHGLLQINSLNKVFTSTNGLTESSVAALRRAGIQVERSASDLLSLVITPF